VGGLQSGRSDGQRPVGSVGWRPADSEWWPGSSAGQRPGRLKGHTYGRPVSSGLTVLWGSSLEDL
jgi:hypothetical protein